DIFSILDAGLQRTIKWLYEIEGALTKQTIIDISNKWKPYRTYASLYLWEAINKNLINNRKLK
ncbi:MAG: hypothetical protein Q8M92_01285, partial [Candidatus Subteraquimicrobiales bacterium]|nr:hypothetical protein [Candidatus Subteraquimicrobiales bacterium]